MAGRGRGRGRGMSFNVENLGFSKGEALPGALLQPPPLFPPLEYKPVPLESGEEWDYMLALKQEFRGYMKDSPYYLKSADKKRDIDRYSDKYQSGQHDTGGWIPDWSRLPKELKIKPRRKVRMRTPNMKPILPARSSTIGNVDIAETLKVLEEKEGKDDPEGQDETEDKKEKKEDEEEEIEEDYYEEEEMEEETDYNVTYFDGGDNYGADEDDDLDDGPTY